MALVGGKHGLERVLSFLFSSCFLYLCLAGLTGSVCCRRAMSDVADGESGDGFACLWAGCEVAIFDSDQALDEHVEATHVKNKRGGGKADKGVVCEWKDCLSDKIYRDSWNLVTHMRYKHTHYKPFVCPHKTCGKAFVQLHQMKKHSKTPHEGSGNRSRKRQTRKQEDSDSEYGEVPVVAEEGSESIVGGVASAGSAKRNRRQPPEVIVSVVVGDEDDEPELQLLGARELRVRSPMERFRVTSPLELEAAAGLLGAASPARPFTPVEVGGERLGGVLSPTSLLASNTHLYPGNSNDNRPGGRLGSLWSPVSFASDHRTLFGSTPTPPMLDDHPNTPVRAFSSQAPETAFVPISHNAGQQQQNQSGHGGEGEEGEAQSVHYFAPVVVVKPSRPSPLPAPMYNNK